MGRITTTIDKKLFFRSIHAIKKALCVSEAIRDLFADINTIPSVTFDNGSEFAEFKNMEEYLNCKVYFMDTSSPWQRGLNEYSNRLIRQYLSKETDFGMLHKNILMRLYIK